MFFTLINFIIANALFFSPENQEAGGSCSLQWKKARWFKNEIECHYPKHLHWLQLSQLLALPPPPERFSTVLFFAFLLMLHARVIKIGIVHILPRVRSTGPSSLALLGDLFSDFIVLNWRGGLCELAYCLHVVCLCSIFFSLLHFLSNPTWQFTILFVGCSSYVLSSPLLCWLSLRPHLVREMVTAWNGMLI